MLFSQFKHQKVLDPSYKTDVEFSDAQKGKTDQEFLDVQKGIALSNNQRNTVYVIKKKQK